MVLSQTKKALRGEPQGYDEKVSDYLTYKLWKAGLVLLAVVIYKFWWHASGRAEQAANRQAQESAAAARPDPQNQLPGR